jgi:ubiquinone/menaquinone biosynthesis C-methylase UbiE
MNNPSPFGNEITTPGLHGDLIKKIKLFCKAQSVLDLGCGKAAWLKRLETEGFKKLVGIDWNPDDTETGAVKIIKGDLEASDIGLGTEKFELVTMIEVIEHMSNPGKLLEHASRHLDDNGMVLITTPNIHSLIQRIKFLATGRLTHFDRGSDPTHYQPVLIEAWERMLPRYGLKIDNIWTYPNCNQLDGISTIWKHLASILQLVLSNKLPGEILCITLRKC